MTTVSAKSVFRHNLLVLSARLFRKLAKLLVDSLIKKKYKKPKKNRAKTTMEFIQDIRMKKRSLKVLIS
jgi:hypothetical protein